jgi:two-component system sensor histidine kinase HydH
MADMSAFPPPPPVDDSALIDQDVIVGVELQGLLRTLIAVRVWVAPLLAVVAGVVVWADPSPWRVWVLGLLVAVAVIASVLMEMRARRTHLTLRAAGPNLLAMAVAQLTLITSSGGVDSPILPVMLPMGLLCAVSLGRRPLTFGLLAVQIIGLAALMCAQASGVAPGLDMPVLYGENGPPAPMVRVVVSTIVIVALVLSAAIGLHIRQRFVSMIDTGLHARAEQLATWKTWSRDLEALSSELAHELKNPLASIKGLSALVARDLPEERTQERMRVLQTEVDRMQGIVDEFLTFSRPLTPLSVAPVDLMALCERARRLHEGTGRTRRVQVVCAGAAPAVPGDVRKLLQVLVNLVQNAIVATAEGSKVELVLSAGTDGVFVDVLDRGPGVAPSLRDRVFEAGVTSKEDGSGLGLPISLAIARQHGGDLALLDRPGGGTIARLSLPGSST